MKKILVTVIAFCLLLTASVKAGDYEKIEVKDDFIRGVDVSSLPSELASGVVYRDFDGNELDEQGFFKFLADNDVNLVRIRVWNDPYDSNGNGYGGGNCNLDTAVSLGSFATEAGLQVMIDFHYSDTWADPSRQLVPKSWQGKSNDEIIDLIGEYTNSSLETLIDAGVNVTMVQIGNETSNCICGLTSEEDMCNAFSSGIKAVREIENKHNKNIKTVIHIESPDNTYLFEHYAKMLDEKNVDYDVFATSYYPMYNGSIDCVTKVLGDISEKYGKEVMISETAWVYTTEDGDGSNNEVWGGEDDENYHLYDYSVKGQMQEIYDAIKTISDISTGIGVIYWEPAWIPVNYIYNESGNYLESAKTANEAAWEEYGSGWATRALAEYDPEHVGTSGEWAGGSAVDNHAWFDFKGYPLESAKSYSELLNIVKTDTHENPFNILVIIIPAAAVVLLSLCFAIFRKNNNRNKD